MLIRKYLLGNAYAQLRNYIESGERGEAKIKTMLQLGRVHQDHYIHRRDLSIQWLQNQSQLSILRDHKPFQANQI